MKFNRVTQTRNNVIDIVKGITILLVIYGHVIQILYMGTGMEFFSDRIEKFICSFHMPLFSLISGYLFYFTCIHRTIKEIFYKRIVGLIQPLLIWGTFYYTLYLVLLNFFGGGRMQFKFTRMVEYSFRTIFMVFVEHDSSIYYSFTI